MQEVSGIWTALATPFLADGEIDWSAYGKLLKLQHEGRVAGVVVFGTTGEAPTLTQDEKIKLIQTARESLPKSIRVMAGTGTSDTRSTLAVNKLAATAGADSLLVVTPPYNKPSQAGLVNHFQTLAAATNLPICLYHVPGRTGQHLTIEAMVRLGQIKGVVAIKEASGNLTLFSKVKQYATGFDTVLSGDDPTFLASLAVGGDGIISVVSNIYPGALVAMGESFKNGDVRRAWAIHQALEPTIDALFLESNPGPLKFALACKGIAANIVREPLAPIEPKTEEILTKALSMTDMALERLELA